jgi:hypothetical protein
MAAKIILYRDANFQGPSITYYADTPELADGWHDAVSSVRVESGIWRLFENINYDKPMGDFGPGGYPQLIPNDQLDSLRVLQET